MSIVRREVDGLQRERQVLFQLVVLPESLQCLRAEGAAGPSRGSSRLCCPTPYRRGWAAEDREDLWLLLVVVARVGEELLVFFWKLVVVLTG
jgi:hypothetical protein